jgi:hypothetical protein
MFITMPSGGTSAAGISALQAGANVAVELHVEIDRAIARRDQRPGALHRPRASRAQVEGQLANRQQVGVEILVDLSPKSARRK